jgi:hypothetical protein
MDDSLERLRAKIAKHISECEAALLTADTSDVMAKELASWKRMAARLAQTVLFEPREHRALRLPPLR